MKIVRGFVFVLLVFSSVLSVAFVHQGVIPAVQALPSIYQGDLVLTGNNVTVIEGRFDINGSIVVKGNATLILRNAVVNLVQTFNDQFSLTFQEPANGNPRLLADNATLTSPFRLNVNFFGNSSCVADKVYSWSTTYINSFWLYDSSQVSISNSQIYAVIVYGGFFKASNSTMRYLQVFGSASANASSSYIEDLTSFSTGDVIVSDSNTYSLYTRDQGLLQLVNSTYSAYTIYNESRVTVSWYLTVNVVDKYDAPVPSASVTAYYSNATVAESRLTDPDGFCRLTLMEKMLNSTGEYPFGNYTVEAAYGVFSNSTTVNMTNNQQITLKLKDFAVPEFPSSVVLLLFMTATLLAIITLKRKLTEHAPTLLDVEKS